MCLKERLSNLRSKETERLKKIRMSEREEEGATLFYWRREVSKYKDQLAQGEQGRVEAVEVNEKEVLGE